MSLREILFGKPKSAKSEKATSSTKRNSASKTTSKTTIKDSTPQKVYRNSEGKIVYKQSTDKVGDILVNPAGVRYKIISESFHTPTGYDDGKLKVRVLTLKPMTKNGKSFEMGDGTVAHARKNGIFKRFRESK